MRGRMVFVAVMLSVAWAAPVHEALAGKGGGGGTVPPGTIYLRGDGDVMWAMDGAGVRTVLPGLSQPTAYNRPSRMLRGGRRWFLHLERVLGETGPGGGDRYDFFAVRDDGGQRVRLTSDPTLQFRWAADWGDETESGATIAVEAGRWTGTTAADTVILASVGIYTARLGFDASGTPTGLDGEPTIAATLPTRGAAGREIADLWQFSLSPDAGRAAFNRVPPNSTQIWIADLQSGEAAPVAEGEDPSWSPDGSRLACFRHVGTGKDERNVIETVRPDGSGRTTVVSKRPRDAASLAQPKWSPDGTALAYKLSPSFDSAALTYVYRVSIDGSGATNLTPQGVGAGGIGYLIDWR